MATTLKEVQLLALLLGFTLVLTAGLMQKTEQAVLEAAREASAYFDRFDKSGLSHAAAHLSLDWLLSDNTTSGIEPEGPLVTGELSPPDSAGRYAVLLPKPPQVKPSSALRLQELHQIVRELVEGIYVFNQLPSISLDSNHDSTTSVTLPSAYQDSLVGETLLSVDYYVKSLLHDSTIAQKDRRGRLLDDWKKLPQGTLREEFRARGMTSMRDDPELGREVYEKRRPPRVRFPPLCVTPRLAQRQLTPRQSTGEEFEQQEAHKRRDVFLQHLEEVSLGLVVRPKQIWQRESVFVVGPAVEVVSGVTGLQGEWSEGGASASHSAHLHAYLQTQRDFVSEHLRKKAEVARQLELLGFTSFMIHLLVTLKKLNKIISVADLVPPRSKDMTRTERELPPTFPGHASRWSPYLTQHSHSSLHGGIHFSKSKHAPSAPPPDVGPSSDEEIEEVLRVAATPPDPPARRSVIGLGAMEPQQVPTCEVGGRTYYVIGLGVESYYPKTPKLPRWVHAMRHELRVQSSRLPQLNDARIQDALRKPLGPRR